MTVSRRTFLKLGVLGIIGAGIAPLSMHRTYDLVTEEVSVPIRGLPADFDGYRIGFLSDFHLGPLVPNDWVKNAIEAIRKAGVDLLVLGGDYIGVPDSSISKAFGNLRNLNYVSVSEIDLPSRIYSDVAGMLSLIKPPDGIIAVFGNHEYRNRPQDCVKAFESNRNIRILCNEAIHISRNSSRIEVVGVDDFLTGIPSLPSACAKEALTTRILVSHNPDYVSRVLSRGFFHFNLALCGHTHGGQICFPLVGSYTYNISDTRFSQGLKTLSGSISTFVYTSRGIGVVEVPYRLNCPPEATVLTLRKA